MKWKLYAILVVVSFAIWVGYMYWQRSMPETSPNNTVTVTSNVVLPASEQAGLLKSIDEYMNTYKLPKGVQNTYDVHIISRLNDSIEIQINPSETLSDFNTTLYARRVSGVWSVDPNAGPWCTLAEFDNQSCEQ